MLRRRLAVLDWAALPVALGSPYPVPTAQAVGSQPSPQPLGAWLLLQSDWEMALSSGYPSISEVPYKFPLVRITFAVYFSCMKQGTSFWWFWHLERSCIVRSCLSLEEARHSHCVTRLTYLLVFCTEWEGNA